jgi:hypothetical protein
MNRVSIGSVTCLVAAVTVGCGTITVRFRGYGALIGGDAS